MFHDRSDETVPHRRAEVNAGGPRLRRRGLCSRPLADNLGQGDDHTFARNRTWGTNLFTLHYAPHTCALATHIALRDAAARYELKRIDFGKTEQQSAA